MIGYMCITYVNSETYYPICCGFITIMTKWKMEFSLNAFKMILRSNPVSCYFDKELVVIIRYRVEQIMKLFKKTTTATSCRTPPNNSVNEQNNKTARIKYNLVGLSAVLCKTATSSKHFTSFIENAVVQR